MITREGHRYLVEGPVTHGTVGALLAEGGRSFEGNRVVVDLSKVTEVDSSAVSLMLEWVRCLRASGREIVYSNPGASLQSLANLYGVADLIPVAAD